MILTQFSRYGNKRRQKLYSQLAALLSCSIELLTAIEILSEEENQTQRRDLIRAVHKRIANGELLSVALFEELKITEYEKATIEAGESTGRLAIVIAELSEHLDRKNRLKKELAMSLAYPCMILLTALAVVYFMMAFMVPIFEETFKRFDGELPAITVLVINASQITTAVFPWLTAIIVIAIVGFIYCWNDPSLKQKLSAILFKIPILKDQLMRAELMSFMNLMTTLTTSKVQLTDALDLCARASKFPTIKDQLMLMKREIVNGGSLNDAMKQSGLFPIKVLSLIRIAEETNTLGKGFKELSEHYRSENEYRQSLLKSIMEPALILFMGLVAGTIVVSMYLPIIEMTVMNE
jgi:type IV pilus assembly protein PilC